MDSSVQTMPPVMTLSEAAKWLRASPATVRRYIATHQLAAVRIGRFQRIRSEDLLDFLASRPVTARCSQKHFKACRDGAKGGKAAKESATG